MYGTDDLSKGSRIQRREGDQRQPGCVDPTDESQRHSRRNHRSFSIGSGITDADGVRSAIFPYSRPMCPVGSLPSDNSWGMCKWPISGTRLLVNVVGGGHVGRMTSSMGRYSFYRRHGVAILLISAALVPLISWGVYRAIRSNSNDVREWLPADYPETQQYAWFTRHFGVQDFIVVSWPDCNREDRRLDEFARTLPRLAAATVTAPHSHA